MAALNCGEAKLMTTSTLRKNSAQHIVIALPTGNYVTFGKTRRTFGNRKSKLRRKKSVENNSQSEKIQISPINTVSIQVTMEINQYSDQIQSI